MGPASQSAQGCGEQNTGDNPKKALDNYYIDIILYLTLWKWQFSAAARNCHSHVSGLYIEAKYLHFKPVFNILILGT